MYKVRVAASGQKIAVYKDDKILKVIQASDETFKPAEAVKYAEELNIQLQKTAEQMVDPAGVITTPTKSEQQSIDMPKTVAPATGVGGPDIMDIQAKLVAAQKQIEALTIHNAQLQESTKLERKARRGLAIAKQEVMSNKLASTESNIEARVMNITAMSDEDISLLERKTAGLSEFESPQHAQKYASSMKIKSRIYRQAAEEAMEDGADDEAVNQESKAAYCDSRVKIAEEFIDEANKPEPEMDMEMGTNTVASDDQDEDDVNVASNDDVNVALDDQDEDDTFASDDEDEDEDNEFDDDDDTTSYVADDIIDQVDQQAEGKAPNMNYANQLGSLYKKVAKQHQLIAKMAAEDGDTDVEKEASQESEDAEKKAAIFATASVNKTEIGGNLVDLYTKIANALSKIADDAEKAGQDDVADEADKEAKSARRKANILFRAQNGVDEEEDKTASADEDEDDKTASVDEDEDDKTASVDEDDKTDECKTASANNTDVGSNLINLYSKIANALSKVADDAEKAGQEDVADEADKEAKEARRKANILFRAQNNVDEDEDSKTASTDEDEVSESEDDDNQESDKEAAVSDEDEVKEPKIAAISTHSEGVSKIASVEVNAMAHDPSIETLASQLWGKIEQ